MASHYLVLRPHSLDGKQTIEGEDGLQHKPVAVCPVFETESEAYACCGSEVMVIEVEVVEVPQSSAG